MEKLTVEIPTDLGESLRARVESGQYVSEEEAVIEALRAAQEQDRAIETWMRKVIVPICDDVKAGTATLLTIDEVKERLRLSR